MADKDDKPAHMLTISKSVEKDIDRWQAGKGEAPPVEAFLPDSTLQEIERASKARDEPVRADQLIPISAQDAAARRTQRGDRLPKMPAQRRVIPAPFRRPRIEGGGHGKSWQPVAAEQVTPGDIVPDVGRVETVEVRPVYVPRADAEAGRAFSVPVSLDPGEDNVIVGEVVVLTGAGGQVRAARRGTQVQAFRKSV